MRGPWRPLAFAAATIVLAAATPATAQTVIVAKAPPGAALELALNGTTLQTAKADDKGVGPMPFQLPNGKTEIDVRVFVDVCDAARKITLVETGWQPAPLVAGCSRHELFGVFSMLAVTTLVVDAAEQNQAVWIRQGKPPARWLDPTLEASEPESSGPEYPTPIGLLGFGSVGLSTLSDFETVACGDGDCNRSTTRLIVRAGAEFWFNRYLAAAGSYLKPLKAQAAGSGTNYTYLTSQISDIVTFTGKAALPLGRVRLWAEGGGLYHRTTLVTDQTMTDITTTVDSVTTTYPGGTQQLLLQTAGFGWIAGGGGELWLKPKIAVYGEFTRSSFTGKPRAGGEGKISDSLTMFAAGIKLRLSR